MKIWYTFINFHFVIRTQYEKMHKHKIQQTKICGQK